MYYDYQLGIAGKADFMEKKSGHDIHEWLLIMSIQQLQNIIIIK